MRYSIFTVLLFTQLSFALSPECQVKFKKIVSELASDVTQTNIKSATGVELSSSTKSIQKGKIALKNKIVETKEKVSKASSNTKKIIQKKKQDFEVVQKKLKKKSENFVSTNLKKKVVPQYKFKKPIVSDCPSLECMQSSLMKQKGKKHSNESQGVFEIINYKSKSSKRTTAYNSITDNNTNSIFTHNYDKDKLDQFGAKALSYIDEAGENNIIFWKTGDKTIGNNIHHRDALTAFYHKEAELQISKDNMKLFNKSFKLRSEAINGARNNLNFDGKSLTKSQGYQFTAKKVKDKMVIQNLDVDSSITSAQVFRDLFNKEKLAFDIVTVLRRIDPSSTSIKSIRVKGLADMLKTSGVKMGDLNKVLVQELKKQYPGGVPKEYSRLKFSNLSSRKQKSSSSN